MLGTSREIVHLYECTHIMGKYTSALHYIQVVVRNSHLLQITVNERWADKLDKWQIAWTMYLSLP